MQRGLNELGKGINGVDDALGGLGASINNVGKRVFVITAALAAATAGVVAFIKASGENAEAQEKEGQTLGLTAEQYGKLQYVIEQTDTSVDAAKVALGRLSKSLQDAADQYSKYYNDSAKESQKHADKVSDNERDLAKTRQSAADKSADIQRNLNEKLRDYGKKNFSSVKGSERDLFKIRSDAARALFKIRSDAARASERLNRDTFEQEQELQTTLTRMSRESNVELGDKAKIFSNLGINIYDATGNLKNLSDLVPELADKFAAMKGGPEKIALALELFGKGGRKLLTLFDEGGDKVRKLSDEAWRLGLIFTPEQIKNGDEFTDSLNKVYRVLRMVKDQATLEFAVGGTQALDAIAEALVKIKGHVIEWASEMAGRAQPAIDRFVQSLEGEGAAKHFDQLTDKLQTFSSAIEIVIGGMKIIWDTLSASIKNVLDIINAVFGTNFNADEILIAVIVVKLIGGFKLLAAAIGVASAAFMLFTGVAAPTIGGVVLAITALVIAFGGIRLAIEGVAQYFQEWYDSLGPNTKAVVDFLVIVFKGIYEVIYWAVTGSVKLFLYMYDAISSPVKAMFEFCKYLLELFGNIISKADETATSMANSMRTAADNMGGPFNSWKATILSIFAELITGAQAVVHAIASIKVGFNVNTGISVGFGYATGGHVNGPGTSNSDSILSWLSDGEFVQRAAAVRKYGVNFMSRINSLNFPAAIARFADGGLVLPQPSFVPGIASASQQQSMGRPLSLTIGGETFAGLLAPDDVAKKLIRYATDSQNRSLGRKPGWYGGR
jgi:hypothetical protein